MSDAWFVSWVFEGIYIPKPKRELAANVSIGEIEPGACSAKPNRPGVQAKRGRYGVKLVQYRVGHYWIRCGGQSV